jgi:hypothetical protein
MWWKTAIDNAGIDPNKITHPLALHLRCICSTMSVTWDYLEYLSSKLLSLVSLTYFALAQIAKHPAALHRLQLAKIVAEQIDSVRWLLNFIRINGRPFQNPSKISTSTLR